MNIFDLKRETELDLKFDNKTNSLLLMFGNHPVFSITEEYGYYQEWSGSNLLDEEEINRLYEIVEKFCESEGI